MGNKGFTLVELIISIALLSVVVMFLFNLLTDLRATNNNTDFNRKNQQKRALIIKNIQEDLTSKKLIGIKNGLVATSDAEKVVKIDFIFKDETTNLEIVNNGENQSISYTNHLGTEKWNLEKQSSQTHINTTCIKYSNSLFDDANFLDAEYFFVKIDIPIIVNENKVNTIDDIELFYIGLKRDLGSEKGEFSEEKLGNYQANTCE